MCNGHQVNASILRKGGRRTATAVLQIVCECFFKGSDAFESSKICINLSEWFGNLIRRDCAIQPHTISDLFKRTSHSFRINIASNPYLDSRTTLKCQICNCRHGLNIRNGVQVDVGCVRSRQKKRSCHDATERSKKYRSGR